MHIQYLIIGQGIAGTLVSHALWRDGKDFLLLDDGNKSTASHTAAAIINPLAGKHLKPDPNAMPVIEQAAATYRALEELLGCSLLHSMEMYYFPEDKATMLHFAAQQLQYPEYFSSSPGISQLENYFSIPYTPGIIKGLFQADAPLLLAQWRNFLEQQQRIITMVFDREKLVVGSNNIEYEGITADKIIFCDGAAGMDNPWLKHIPFTANRGDALLLDIPGLPADVLYEHGLRLAPYTDKLFWYGSNYRWNYTDLNPDNTWAAYAVRLLKGWLKLPFEVKEHKVAARPTTAGQKVFAGIHPEISSIAYLAGLGTRGFSWGPFWAEKLAATL